MKRYFEIFTMARTVDNHPKGSAFVLFKHVHQEFESYKDPELWIVNNNSRGIKFYILEAFEKL